MEESGVEMEDRGQLDRDRLILVQIQRPQNEDCVGVHSLENMPEPFKPGRSIYFKHFELIQFIRSQEWAKEHSYSKNRMTVLFCSPAAAETAVLKEVFHLLKNYPNPNPRYKIILLDAKNPEKLRQSFEKVVRIYLPNMKIEKKNSPDAKTIHKVYKKMNSENDKKVQSLFVFVGAACFSEIQPFLPHVNDVLPLCHFLVTTESKTTSWESEESKSEKWSIGKFLLRDKELICFNSIGVYSAFQLPASFQPVPDFTGREEIIDKLVLLFQNNLPASRSLTAITGISGIGKRELVKKFLSTHHKLFAKVVIFDAKDPLNSLLVFAYNCNLDSKSEMEGAFDSAKLSFLLSEIAKDLQHNDRILFVFDAVKSLQAIKDYLPSNLCQNNVICDVILTSQSRNWQKEEDMKFYKDNGYNFNEIPLFEGLSLNETHEFCSKILTRNKIIYIREDLKTSIGELHKLTDGFPWSLNNLTASISKSSQSNPEWEPKLHILNFLCQGFQIFSRFYAPKVIDGFPEESLHLFKIMCLMDPRHLKVDMISYFFLEHKNPFNPPPQTYEPAQVERVKTLLRILELAALIQIDRQDDGQKNKIQIPAFLRAMVNEKNTSARILLEFFLRKPKRPCSTWAPALRFKCLWPHILSLNESYYRSYGYHNQVLIHCARNHLEFLKNPPENQIPGEERPSTDYATEEEIKQLLNENLYTKTACGDFSKLEAPGLFFPTLFFILFLMDYATDVISAAIMWKAGYFSYSCLAFFLLFVPGWVFQVLHSMDRNEYRKQMRVGQTRSCRDIVLDALGPFYSYIFQLWYTWKFEKETDNLERALLYERLCVLRANAEYNGIVEAFIESLPQLLLQFPLYLLSFTQEYSDLSRVMKDSFIPFEFSLVVSLFSFGLALTKLESVSFGWKMEFSGIKLLGYRSIHLLSNVTHAATLVFCSGTLSMIFPSFIFVVSLTLCLTATVWFLSNNRSFWAKLKCLRNPSKLYQTSLQIRVQNVLASFHPVYVERGTKLELSSKDDFMKERLDHDIFHFRRRPKNSDLVYEFVFIQSVIVSVFASIYSASYKCQEVPGATANATEPETEKIWAFHVMCENSFLFVLWFPLLCLLQITRQLLNLAYLKYPKVPPSTEDYISNDPDGIIRYPANLKRWIQKRLYHQMRQNRPSVFSQTWTQMKEALNDFNSKPISIKFEILLLGWVKVIHVSFFIIVLYLAVKNTMFLTGYPVKPNFIYFEQ